MIKDLFKTKCLACHGSNGQKPHLANYNDAKAASPEIQERIQSSTNPMPPKDSSYKLSEDEISQIVQWVNLGSPEFSTNSKQSGTSTATETNSEVSFETSIQPLIAQHCLKCHGPNLQPPSLSQESVVKDNIKLIIKRLDDANNPMPPSGPLDPAMISMFKKWGDIESNENDSNETSTSVTVTPKTRL